MTGNDTMAERGRSLTRARKRRWMNRQSEKSFAHIIRRNEEMVTEMRIHDKVQKS
jgi:hypothetical protein